VAVLHAMYYELDTAEIKISSINVINRRISIDLLYARMTIDVNVSIFIK
jgi:hypothetical protein